MEKHHAQNKKIILQNHHLVGKTSCTKKKYYFIESSFLKKGKLSCTKKENYFTTQFWKLIFSKDDRIQWIESFWCNLIFFLVIYLHFFVSVAYIKRPRIVIWSSFFKWIIIILFVNCVSGVKPLFSPNVSRRIWSECKTIRVFLSSLILSEANSSWRPVDRPLTPLCPFNSLVG